MNQVSPLNPDEAGIKYPGKCHCDDTDQNRPLKLIRPRENDSRNVGADLEEVLPRGFG